MGRICMVEACQSEYYPGCGLSYHKFPKDPNVREIWTNIIPTSSSRKLTDASVLCSKHFVAQDYVPCLSRPVLKCDAVPSVFLLSKAEAAEYVRDCSLIDSGVPDPDPVADEQTAQSSNLLLEDEPMDSRDDTSPLEEVPHVEDNKFSWQDSSRTIPITADVDELEDVPDNVSMYCDEEDTSMQTAEQCSKGVTERLHEGFQCNICNGDIEGFRYTCIECHDFDLCGGCEATRAHHHHYVLRVPGPRPYNELQGVLATIRMHLMKEQDPIHSSNDDLRSLKSEVKEEELDPESLCEDEVCVSPGPRLESNPLDLDNDEDEDVMNSEDIRNINTEIEYQTEHSSDIPKTLLFENIQNVPPTVIKKQLLVNKVDLRNIIKMLRPTSKANSSRSANTTSDRRDCDISTVDVAATRTELLESQISIRLL